MDLASKPALQRRRLLRELTQMRKDAKLTQLQASKRLRWSQSKFNRMENGEVGLSYTDLSALLQVYGKNTPERMERMGRMAEIAKQSSLPELIEVYADRAFRRYLELEEIADQILQFENAIVPGLLQTPRYADGALKNANRLWEVPEDEMEEKLAEIAKKGEFRAARQDAFFKSVRAGQVTGSFILDEAVIRRAAGAENGDTSVMVEQLLHLKELSRQGEVAISVLPFSAGMNAGMSGPFVILNFPDDGDNSLLYVEGPRGDFATSEEPLLTNRFSNVFGTLQERAVHGEALAALLDDQVNRLQNG